MTPAARYAAAIDVLGRMTDGASAERALKAWARENRYAGSKDRAAVRDHVFDVLRQKRSVAHYGGGSAPRALVLGLLRKQGVDPATVFGGGGYGPVALTDAEIEPPQGDPTGAIAVDLPDEIWPTWQADLGADANQSAVALQSRGPIVLRVNLRRGSRDAAALALAGDGIETQNIAGSKTALLVVANARRIALSQSYLNGLVELQDLASQQAIAAINHINPSRILDYCAGGGGKALAMADQFDAAIYAHDIAPERMVDLAPRAKRAQVAISHLLTAQLGQAAPFDLVFCDAPCSGSGTWRRTPESKWSVSLDKLHEFNLLQGEVIETAARYVAASGCLVYATCSVLKIENEQVVARFVSGNPDWSIMTQNQRLPDADGDGFFYTVLQNIKNNL